MERRAFLVVSAKKGMALMLASGAVLSLEGCPAMDALEQWLPEGIYAVDAIVTALNPAAGSILAIATAALPKLWIAVQNAITEYKSTNPPPVGTLAKVATALQDVSDQLTDVLGALPVSLPNLDILAIEAGLKLVIATLNYFAQKNGATVSAKARTAAVAKSGTPVAPATSRADFAKKWNALGIKRADGSAVTVH